jgi:phosphoribosyl 1,2-cyclic phosphate phosphodiesterase
MKLLFLGTGSAEGLPALFCRCAVCAEARRLGGRDRRTRSSVLLDDVIKVDLTPDTLTHAHRYGLDLSRLQHLLFTHTDDDHFAVRELQYLSPSFAPERDAAPVTVWATHFALKKLTSQSACFFERAPVRLEPMTPFTEYAVGHLRVTPIPARHKPDELCLNFLVEGRDGGVLLYATDTGWYEEPTWDFLRGRRIDAVVAECGRGVGASAYEGHLSADEACGFRRRLVDGGGLLAAAPFWVTHIAHTGLLLHDELSARLAPHGISVAYDGLCVTV